MPELNAKAAAALSMFNGRWALDLRRSDPITPMLAALKTPYLIRKLAASVQMEQTICVQGNNMEIKNASSIGTSSVVHIVNAGEVVLTDAAGEQTLDDTFVDETAEFPVVIRAVLPNGKGITVDSRKINNDVEMEQRLEFRTVSSADPIVIRRLWNRIGNVTNIKVDSSAKSIKMVPQLKAEPIEVLPQQPSTETTSAPVTLATVDDRPVEVNLEKKDWATGLLLLAFFTSSWFRSSYFESFVWIALFLLHRSNAIFPAPHKGMLTSDDWWDNPSARFAATAAAMVYATRVVLFPVGDDSFTTALEALLAVGAYGWTRRFDIADLDIVAVFQTSQPNIPRVWMELCVVGVLCTAVLAPGWTHEQPQDDDQIVHLATIILGILLFGVARYRVQVSSMAVSTSLTSPATGGKVSARTSINPVSQPLSPQDVAFPQIRVIDHRVSSFSSKPFAQYLVEVVLPGSKRPIRYAVWCRYRDLRLLRSDILQAYRKNNWKERVPFFPSKTWASTNAAVIAKRQSELDQFFSKVFQAHGDVLVHLERLRRIFQLDDTLHVSLQEIRESLRVLGKAKRACEHIASVGETDGWTLVKVGESREYVKQVDVQTKYFKSVKVINQRPHVLIEKIMKNRPQWDTRSMGSLDIRRIKLDEEEALKTFGGMLPYSSEKGDEGVVTITRVVRTSECFLDFKPHDLLVFQVALEDDRTGRFLVIESSVDPDFENRAELLQDEDMEAGLFCRDNVKANGFVLEPMSGGRSLLTAVRAEDFGNKPFCLNTL